MSRPSPTTRAKRDRERRKQLEQQEKRAEREIRRQKKREKESELIELNEPGSVPMISPVEGSVLKNE